MVEVDLVIHKGMEQEEEVEQMVKVIMVEVMEEMEVQVLR